MSEKYRIQIEKVGDESDETLLLIEGSRDIVRAALGFAPAALGDEPTNTEPSAPVNATSSYMTPDGPVIGDDRPKQTRTRRTKAQIEADRAAELAAGEPVTAPVGVPTEAPLSTPMTYAPPAAEPVTPATPYNPFAPVAS